MTETGLVYLNKARVELAKTVDLSKVKDVRDKAEALRIHAKACGESLQSQNAFAEIRLRAQRRGGGNPQCHERKWIDSSRPAQKRIIAR